MATNSSSPVPLWSYLQEFIAVPVEIPVAKTMQERVKKHREKKHETRGQQIAVLDMETDPFDNVSKKKIFPFLAMLYSDQFETITIWDDNHGSLINRLLSAIEALPGKFTIYAHNGGKFDWMFLVHKLRGEVSFKGRGIMSATIGRHEIRDSFHLIPEALATYHKEQFDYKMLYRNVRQQHKQTIIDYCLSDCKYLFDLVKAFVNDFGLKLSIGQAATMRLREHYEIAKFSEAWDGFIRQFFYGGRVECLAGAGEFTGPYKLYDINSSYPYVMATRAHPVGGFKSYDLRGGQPNALTCFIDLDCVNRGALIGRNADGHTTATIERGRFYTTIWEYEIALKYNLISDVQINFCIDCSERTNFADFILPLAADKERLKDELELLKKSGDILSENYLSLKSQYIFSKLLQNNAYGKQAQNPRNFREYYLTDPDEMPPQAWFKSVLVKGIIPDEHTQPTEECDGYWIWSKPCPSFSFNNVGTAASITGGARADLLEAIQLATDPIYCDTDSLICRDLSGVEMHPSKLGAWDIEDEFSRVVIAGKKLYAGWFEKPRLAPSGQISEYKLRSKGTAGLTYSDLLEMCGGKTIPVTSKGVTMTRTGKQNYITREIRATAANKRGEHSNVGSW